MAKEKRWYCERGGVRRGPFSGREIRRMVRTGEIVATDYIWKEGVLDRVVAGSVPKLFKRVGQSKRSGPSALLMTVAGLLAIAGIALSPLGDLTHGLTGNLFVGSVIFCVMCLAGALATFIVAIVGKEIQPMIVPTEGRLVTNSGLDAHSGASGDSGLLGKQTSDSGDAVVSKADLVVANKPATAMIGHAFVSELVLLVRSLFPPASQAGKSFTRAVLAGMVILVAVLAVVSFFPGERQRHLVAGQVTFRDKPVNVGFIKFTPLAKDGKVLTGSIREGRYALKADHGSTGGTYAVQITGYTGIPKEEGAVTNLLGEQLFPPIDRTVELRCPSLSLDVKCDSD
jgi:hypothetical protein